MPENENHPDLISEEQVMQIFDQNFDTVVTHVWETWTKNGLGLDADEMFLTMQSVQDAVTNAYTDGVPLHEWAAATLARLNRSGV